MNAALKSFKRYLRRMGSTETLTSHNPLSDVAVAGEAIARLARLHAEYAVCTLVLRKTFHERHANELIR